MRSVLILTLVIITTTFCNAQQKITEESTVGKLQGVWSRKSVHMFYTYQIYKGFRSISLSKHKDDAFLSLIISVVGFLEENAEPILSNLKAEGDLRDFTLTGSLNKETGKISAGPDMFEFPHYDGINYDYYVVGMNLDIFWYRLKKKNNLLLFPLNVWEDFLEHCQTDARDYILEFLEIDVRELTQTTPLFKEDKSTPILKLNKGDIIEVKSIDQEFVKVEYNQGDTNLISGYVKYTDVSHKAPIPSFDPKKATTEIEKAICSDVVLASLDRQMAQTYKIAKKQNSEKVKTSQRAWIKKRNKKCKGIVGHELVELLKQLYRERMKELK
jgi:uncharacterized protein YecT (DUF1311 family)